MKKLNHISQQKGTITFCLVSLVTFMLIFSKVYADELVLTSAGQIPANPVSPGTPITFSVGMNNIGSPTIAAYLRIRVDGQLINASSSDVTSSSCSVFTINPQWFYCNAIATNGSSSGSITWVNPTSGNHTVRLEGSCYLYGIDNNSDGFWDPCPSVNSNPIEFNVQVGSTIEFTQISVTNSETDKYANLSVERKGDLTGSASVQVVTADGSAIANEDYVSTTKTLSWASGETNTIQVQIPIVDNDIVETTETFFARLQNVTGNAVLGSKSIATISLIDSDLPVINISASIPTASEEKSVPGEIRVTVDNDPQRIKALTVNYRTSGAAKNGVDYNSIGTSLGIPVGISSVVIPIIPIDDSIVELTEAAVVTLSDSSGYILGGSTSASVNIIDNDIPTINIAYAGSGLVEGQSLPGELVVSSSLPVGPAGLTVNLNHSGTATPGSLLPADYKTLPGNVFFSPGTLEVRIPVEVFDDGLVEETETIVTQVVSGTNYNSGNSVLLTMPIADNDKHTVNLSATPLNLTEDTAGIQTLYFTLDQPAIGSGLNVYFVLGGTALNGEDYNIPAQVVVVPAGQSEFSLMFPVLADDLVEENETLTLSLSTKSDYLIGSSNAVTFNINNDDIYRVTLNTTQANASEQGLIEGVCRIEVSNDPARLKNISINLNIAGNASNGDDYNLLTSPVIIPAGQTEIDLHLVPKDDVLVEPMESIDLNIIPSANYVIGSENLCKVNIADNDNVVLPTVSLSPVVIELSENAVSGAIVTATLSEPAGVNGLLVKYLVAGTASVAGGDYQVLSGEVIIGPNETQADITVMPIDNNLVEGDETVILSLVETAEYQVIQTSSANVIIKDDDLPTVNLINKQVNATELNETTGSCTVVVENDPDRLKALFVNFTVSGSATPVEDFIAFGTNIDIPPGISNKDIILKPVDDNIIEGQENILLSLKPDANYIVGMNECEIVITSDDKPSESPTLPVVSLTVLDAIATEADTKPARFLISLDAPADIDGLAVQLAFAGSATASTAGTDGDYIAIGEAITIAAGSMSTSFEIVPIDDTLKESEETIEISIVPSDAYIISDQNSVQANIVDDEPDTTDGNEIVIEPVNNLILQKAGLDEDVVVVIEIKDETGNLLQGAEIIWTLNSTVVNDIPLESADFVTDVNGRATAVFHTAAKPQIYTLKSKVTIQNNQGELLEVAQNFLIEAGISKTVPPDTPQSAIASTLDKTCITLDSSIDSLNENQQALLNRCNDLAEASVAGNSAEVQQALKEIAPEEVVSQGIVSSDIAMQQLSNIGQRLTALRRGIKGVSFSGLSFQLKEESLPGNLLDYLLFADAKAGTESNKISGESVPGGLLDDRLGIFMTGSLRAGVRDQTINESGFEFDTRGITLGMDYRYTDTLVFGTALGLAKTDLAVDNQGGGLDAKGSSLSFFSMLYTGDNSYVNAVFNFGRNSIDMTRGVRYKVGNTIRNLTAEGDTTSFNKSLSLEGGYQFVLKNTGLTTELLTRVDYLSANIDGYTEKNAEEFNLNINKQNVQSLIFVAGGQAFMAISQSWGVLQPAIGFTWEYENETAHSISGTFVNDPAAANFNFKSVEDDNNYFRLSVGFSAVLKYGMSLFFQYDNIVSKDFYSEENYSLGGRFERRF